MTSQKSFEFKHPYSLSFSSETHSQALSTPFTQYLHNADKPPALHYSKDDQDDPEDLTPYSVTNYQNLLVSPFNQSHRTSQLPEDRLSYLKKTEPQEFTFNESKYEKRSTSASHKRRNSNRYSEAEGSLTVFSLKDKNYLRPRLSISKKASETRQSVYSKDNPEVVGWSSSARPPAVETRTDRLSLNLPSEYDLANFYRLADTLTSPSHVDHRQTTSNVPSSSIHTLKNTLHTLNPNDDLAKRTQTQSRTLHNTAQPEMVLLSKTPTQTITVKRSYYKVEADGSEIPLDPSPASYYSAPSSFIEQQKPDIISTLRSSNDNQFFINQLSSSKPPITEEVNLRNQEEEDRPIELITSIPPATQIEHSQHILQHEQDPDPVHDQEHQHDIEPEVEIESTPFYEQNIKEAISAFTHQAQDNHLSILKPQILSPNEYALPPSQLAFPKSDNLDKKFSTENIERLVSKYYHHPEPSLSKSPSPQPLPQHRTPIHLPPTPAIPNRDSNRPNSVNITTHSQFSQNRPNLEAPVHRPERASTKFILDFNQRSITDIPRETRYSNRPISQDTYSIKPNPFNSSSSSYSSKSIQAKDTPENEYGFINREPKEPNSIRSIFPPTNTPQTNNFTFALNAEDPSFSSSSHRLTAQSTDLRANAKQANIPPSHQTHIGSLKDNMSKYHNHNTHMSNPSLRSVENEIKEDFEFKYLDKSTNHVAHKPKTVTPHYPQKEDLNSNEFRSKINALISKSKVPTLAPQGLRGPQDPLDTRNTQSPQDLGDPRNTHHLHINPELRDRADRASDCRTEQSPLIVSSSQSRNFNIAQPERTSSRNERTSELESSTPISRDSELNTGGRTSERNVRPQRLSRNSNRPERSSMKNSASRNFRKKSVTFTDNNDEITTQRYLDSNPKPKQIISRPPEASPFPSVKVQPYQQPSYSTSSNSSHEITIAPGVISRPGKLVSSRTFDTGPKLKNPYDFQQSTRTFTTSFK